MNSQITGSDKTAESTRRNEKKLTIRNIVVTVLVIIFFVAIILEYYRMLYNEKRENVIKTGEMTAKESADYIDQYLSTNIDSIKLASYTLDEMITEKRSDAEIQDYLVGQSTALKNAVIGNSSGLYGYINGRFFSGTNWVPPEDYVATERPWYTRPMEHPGIITIMDPYVDVQSGNIMLALGKMLCDGESVISVDVSLDEIQRRTEEAVISGNSDIEMLINENGVVVAHSDPAELGKNYNDEAGTVGAEIVNRLTGNGDYYFEFVYGEYSYIVYVAEIQNGWVCISVMDSTQVYAALNSIMVITVTVVIAIVLIMSIIMNRSNRYLHMSARAIAANEAKTAFLSNMSHEIRTPINTILGMNELILRESNDKNIVEYSENVKNAGKSLLGLVNDILDFSKIEAGKIDIIPVDYDLSVVINDIVSMVSKRAENKGLILELNINREIPKYLHGDDMRLGQVLANLLTNAVKYTERGIVFFGMGFNKCEEDPDSVELIVSVKDTGIGIKEEDMQKLFTQFERIEENRNRNIEGTGLGMNITKNLLEMMGSEINVESEYGKGSTFSFKLKQKVNTWEPIGDYRVSYKNNIESRKKYHEKFIAPDAKVLAVDDNPMNLVVFKNLVKKTKVKVDTAGSGNDGFLRTRDKTYDIIFLDHMMPHKDGIETLHDIREDSENKNSKKPIICLTANAVAGAREKYLEEGFDDYLSKPVDPEKLEEMILSYLPKELVIINPEDNPDDENEGDKRDLSIFEGSGINTAEGLKNSGSLESYLELLKIFHDSVSEKTEELYRYYEEKDFKNYTIKVHALKSSARIIGASDFGEKIQKLEDAGKSMDTGYIRDNHALLMEEYAGYGKLISGLFDKPEECDKPDADRDFMKTVYEDIKSAADEMDCDRLETIFAETDKYNIPKEEEEIYKKLKAASNQYDYDGILTILSEG